MGGLARRPGIHPRLGRMVAGASVSDRTGEVQVMRSALMTIAESGTPVMAAIYVGFRLRRHLVDAQRPDQLVDLSRRDRASTLIGRRRAARAPLANGAAVTKGITSTAALRDRQLDGPMRNRYAACPTFSLRCLGSLGFVIRAVGPKRVETWHIRPRWSTRSTLQGGTTLRLAEVPAHSLPTSVGVYVGI